MTTDNQPHDAVTLRQRAEAHVAQAEAASRDDVSNLAPADVERLLHELHVHQIELELQNEELRRTQAELAASRARYFDERRQMEEAQREQAARFRLALKAAKGGTWEWDLRTNENHWDEEVWPLYGLAPHSCEPSYEAWLQSIHPADRAAAARAVMTAARDHTELNAEWRVNTRDGTERWLMSRGQPLRTADGAVTRYVGAVVDITERKRMEAALRESETRYRLISENAADVIWVLDPIAGQFTYVSPSVERLRGYTAAEVLAQPIAEALTPASFDRISALMAENLPAFLAQSSGTVSYITEIDQPHKDGSIVHTEATTTYLRNERGQLEIVGVTRDITERKHAEATLAASEQRLRALIENIGDGIELIDAQGQVVYASPSAARILGYPQAELIGSATRLIHPEDRAAAEGTLAQVFGAPGQPIGQTYRVRHGDGTWRWVEGTATNLLADPAMGGIVANFRDITERRQMEELYRSLVAASPDAISVVDTNGRLRFASPKALAMFGHAAAEDAFDLPVLRWFAPHEYARVVENLQRILQGEVRDNLEYELCRVDGTRFYGEITTSLLRDAAGSVHGLMAITRDITARRQAETALRESEELYRNLVAALDVSLCRWLPDTTLVYANDKYRRMFGIQGDATGQRWLDFLPVEARAETAAVYRELAAHPRTLTYEHPVVADDGSMRYFQWIDTPILDAEGHLTVFQSVGIDITERKRIENLVAAQRDLARIAGTAPTREEAWPHCLDVALRVAGMDCGGIYVWDAVQRVLELVHHQGLSADFVREAARYPADSPNARAVLTGNASYFHADALRRMPLLDREGLQCLAAIPIQYQGRIVGAVNVASHTMTEIPAAVCSALEAIALEIGNIAAYLGTEALLRESEEQYRGLIESLDNVITTVDYDGELLYVNDVAAQQMGSTVQALTGKTVYDIFPESVASEQLEDIRRVMHTDRGVVAEYQIIVQGQPRWHRTTKQPIHDEQGRVTSVLVNSTDIHDLKTTQEELLELNRTLEERVRERTAQVQDLYDHAPMGYHSLDADGHVVMVNQTELDWLGYALEEVIGRPLPDFLTPAGRASFEAYFPKFKQTGVVRDAESEMVRKDGTHFPVLINSSAICDAHGNFVMSRSSLLDITARKQAEYALRESEQQNRLMFDAAPDATALFDADGQLIRVNAAFERLTGYRAEQVHGRMFSELALLSREQIAQQSQATLAAFKSSRIAAIEFQIRRANGEPRDVSVHMFGITIGGRQHHIATTRDITAEKQAAEALHRANTELARAVRAKDEFLANMSHELRTPLSAILLFTENLLAQYRGPLNERQQAALRNIEASGRHLLALINDILDLSKVEAGRLELQREPVVIAEVCQASLVFVKEAASKKGLRLGFHLGDQLTQITADPRRLKQMLVNLLSNAVKFTPAGGQVDLEVDVDAAAGVVRFAVQDTGIGIPNEDMSRLFRPFTQLDAGLNRQHEGSGLGLALVHRLAELHGGSIAVESVVGQGSRFTIALPYNSPESTPADLPEASKPAATTEAAPTSERSGVRILLAEDNEANIRGVSEYLQDRGYDVVVAHNGQEALHLAAASRPALILMDIQMPTMDGLEAMQRLRARSECAATPIIALTALAMPGDRERCLAAGANDYLTKPVSLKGLVETIQTLLADEPLTVQPSR